MKGINGRFSFVALLLAFALVAAACGDGEDAPDTSAADAAALEQAQAKADAAQAEADEAAAAADAAAAEADTAAAAAATADAKAADAEAALAAAVAEAEGAIDPEVLAELEAQLQEAQAEAAAASTEAEEAAERLAEELAKEPERPFVDVMNERLLASGEEPKVIWVAGGGLSKDAHLTSCLRPFARDTGAEIVYVEGRVGLGFIKAEVEASGDPTFDTIKINEDEVQEAIDEGWIQELDWSVINTDDLTPAQHPTDYAIAHTTFGSAVFYNTDKWPDGGPVPETWADFWDAETFPGPRGVDGNGWGMPFRGLAEAAMVAAGADPTDLYPLDIDAALAKMDELAPHISVYFTSGAQVTQLMLAEEVDLIHAWTGRAWDAIQQGAPYKIMPQTHVLETVGTPMVVLAGAKSPTYASAAIGYCGGAEGQAEYTNHAIYAPSNVLSVPLVDPALSRDGWLGTDPSFADATIIIDSDFYKDDRDAYMARWNEWRTAQ
jgi:putative spermidine/putrescine transport system substrate-binding protein